MYISMLIVESTSSVFLLLYIPVILNSINIKYLMPQIFLPTYQINYNSRSFEFACISGFE